MNQTGLTTFPKRDSKRGLFYKIAKPVWEPMLLAFLLRNAASDSTEGDQAWKTQTLVTLHQKLIEKS